MKQKQYNLIVELLFAIATIIATQTENDKIKNASIDVIRRLQKLYEEMENEE